MRKTSYRYSEPLAMLYIALLLVSSVLTRKFFHTPFGLMSAASLISPLWYILSDIIAEVYGYDKARRLFYTAIIFLVIFSGLLTFISSIDSQSEEINHVHHAVFAHMFRLSLFFAVSIIVAWQINIFLLLRWKFLFRGRYFWLRSLGGSGIALILYSSFVIFSTLVTIMPLEKIIELIVLSCALKLLVIIVFSVPSQMICTYLKRVEQVDMYETVSFNPFASVKQHTPLPDLPTQSGMILVADDNDLPTKKVFYKFWNKPGVQGRTPIIAFPGGPGVAHQLYERHSLFLSDANPLLLFDPLGTGASDSLDSGEYTVARYVKTAKALIDHFGFKKIILVGGSYGSVAAQQFILDYPEMVERLILIAGIPSYEFSASAKQQLLARGTLEQIAMGHRLFNGELYTKADVSHYFKVMAPLYSVKAAQAAEGEMAAPPVDCAVEPLRYGFTHCLRTIDFRPQLPTIKVPTLILVGKEDWITPEDQAQVLHQLIPNSRLVVIENAGHALAVDAAERYKQELLAFIG
jgi:proline iminopeptidase